MKYNLSYQYPYPKNNYCGADHINSFVIDPKGTLYRCWHDLGIEELSVGSVIDDSPRNSNRLFQFMTNDITVLEECSECKFLPICLGGCPNMSNTNDKKCCQEKFTLERFLQSYIKEMKQIG